MRLQSVWKGKERALSMSEKYTDLCSFNKLKFHFRPSQSAYQPEGEQHRALQLRPFSPVLDQRRMNWRIRSVQLSAKSEGCALTVFVQSTMPSPPVYETPSSHLYSCGHRMCARPHRNIHISSVYSYILSILQACKPQVPLYKLLDDIDCEWGCR